MVCSSLQARVKLDRSADCFYTVPNLFCNWNAGYHQHENIWKQCNYPLCYHVLPFPTTTTTLKKISRGKNCKIRIYTENPSATLGWSDASPEGLGVGSGEIKLTSGASDVRCFRWKECLSFWSFESNFQYARTRWDFKAQSWCFRAVWFSSFGDLVIRVVDSLASFTAWVFP